MIESLFLSLLHCTLNIFATEKLLYHGGWHGLEIYANSHFYGPEKAIKVAKKQKKVEENF